MTISATPSRPGELRVIVLTGIGMLCFAGNSLLCRLALRQTENSDRAVARCGNDTENSAGDLVDDSLGKGVGRGG